MLTTEYMPNAICSSYGSSILNSPTVVSPILLEETSMSGKLIQYMWIGTLLIKLAIISHRKPVIPFESTTSLLRKLTRFLDF